MIIYLLTLNVFGFILEIINSLNNLINIHLRRPLKRRKRFWDKNRKRTSHIKRVFKPFLIFYNLYAPPTPALTLAQRKRALIILAAVPILSYLLIVASFLPSVYGQSFPVERARFTGQLCLVAGLMIEAALLGSLSAQFRTRIIEALNLKLVSAIFLAIAAFYPLRAAWISLADVPVYRQRAVWWDEREARIYQLIEQGQTDIIVQQFDGVEGVKELDVNANHWANRCAAKYYGLDSIRAFSDVIFP